MKKAFLVGAVGCGKTTFKQVMMQEKRSYDKTQAIEFFNNLIDSPGEFTEHRRMYSALNVTANASDVVVMMQSVIDHRQIFSPAPGIKKRRWCTVLREISTHTSSR